MALIDFLSRPVAYHPALARLVGSITAAVMLSQAIYWQQRVPQRRPVGCPGPDWWHHSAAEWESETALTKNEQLTARKKLKKTTFWQESRSGIPARIWFRVDLSELEKIMQNQQITVKRTTSCSQQRQPDGRFSGSLSSFVPTSLYTETTTDNTTTCGASNKEKKYLELAKKHGGVHSPVGFEIAKKKQWEEGGGMSESDLSQLREWVAIEHQKKARAEKHRIQVLESIEKDIVFEQESLDREEMWLETMPPELSRSILAAKKGGEKRNDS